MLGWKELIILLVFFGVPLAIGLVIWRVSRRTSGAAARLAKLDELRAQGKITPAEYERQRATIISGV